MLYTLNDARTEVADVIVPGGTCSTGGFIDQRINSAIRRLMLAHDGNETMAMLKVMTDKDYVTLPRGLKSPRAVNISGVPSPLHHYSYSFAPAGPGENENSGCPVTLEMAPGHYYTAFDPHPGTKLIAFSPSVSDQGKQITVYGRKENGEDILGGLTLTINRWKGGIEGEIQGSRTFDGPEADDEEIETITGITLPTGLISHVTLMAVDVATWGMYFLSKYHPDELKPGYRRFYLRNLGCCPCNPDCCREVSILAKRDFIPLTRDDEVLPVQSLDAIKFMVMAIAEENQRNVQTANAYARQAMAALNAHSRDTIDGQQMTITVQDDYGLSGMGNLY